MLNEIRVIAEWDPEAGVFVATSEDVPGLVTEAATQELLLQKLNERIPELLKLNEHHLIGDDLCEVSLSVTAHQVSRVRIHA